MKVRAQLWVVADGGGSLVGGSKSPVVAFACASPDFFGGRFAWALRDVEGWLGCWGAWSRSQVVE